MQRGLLSETFWKHCRKTVTNVIWLFSADGRSQDSGSSLHQGLVLGRQFFPLIGVCREWFRGEGFQALINLLWTLFLIAHISHLRSGDRSQRSQTSWYEVYMTICFLPETDMHGSLLEKPSISLNWEMQMWFSFHSPREEQANDDFRDGPTSATNYFSRDHTDIAGSFIHTVLRNACWNGKKNTPNFFNYLKMCALRMWCPSSIVCCGLVSKETRRQVMCNQFCKESRLILGN